MRRLSLLLFLLLSWPVLAAEWPCLSFQDGSSVAMPGSAVHVLEPARVAGASANESWTSRAGEGLFSARLTVGDGEVGSLRIERGEAEFMASDMHGRLVRIQEASLGTLRGWEFEFERRRHGDVHYVLWMADGRRECMLTLVRPLRSASRATARRFFDSLRLGGQTLQSSSCRRVSSSCLRAMRSPASNL